MNGYFIGADFGQSQDYSTIAVVERAELRGEFDFAYPAWRKVTELRLRHLERIELGPPYPEVVDRVAHVSHAAEARGTAHLTVDATGVGRAVVDLLKRARPSGLLMPVLVTGREQPTRPDDSYRAPKRDLIVGLQVLFRRGGCGSRGRWRLRRRSWRSWRRAGRRGRFFGSGRRIGWIGGQRSGRRCSGV